MRKRLAVSGAQGQVRQEPGLVVRARRVLGVHRLLASGSLHHLYLFRFWCVVKGGFLTRTAETPDLGYIPRGALLPLTPHHQKPIAEVFAIWHDGWQGATFDP